MLQWGFGKQPCGYGVSSRGSGRGAASPVLLLSCEAHSVRAQDIGRAYHDLPDMKRRPFYSGRGTRRTTGDRMQLIQLLRLQKAHDQNRQLMRFVMMPLLSCARAAIVMFQSTELDRAELFFLQVPGKSLWRSW